MGIRLVLSGLRLRLFCLSLLCIPQAPCFTSVATCDTLVRPLARCPRLYKSCLIQCWQFTLATALQFNMVRLVLGVGDGESGISPFPFLFISCFWFFAYSLYLFYFKFCVSSNSRMFCLFLVFICHTLRVFDVVVGFRWRCRYILSLYFDGVRRHPGPLGLAGMYFYYNFLFFS